MFGLINTADMVVIGGVATIVAFIANEFIEDKNLVETLFRLSGVTVVMGLILVVADFCKVEFNYKICDRM
jgi:hypothetical protein